MARIIDAGALAVASSHMARNRPTPNADPARLPLNEILIGTADPAADVRRRRGEVQLRANSGWGVEVLLTASPEWWRSATEDQQREWRDRSVKFLEEQFGAANVAHLRWHRDETSPHLTGFVIPTKPGKGEKPAYSAEHLLGGKEKLARLQDGYADAVSTLGLKRGVRGSQADHTTIKEYYQALAGVGAVPTPTVEVPPVSLTNGARSRWANEQTQRIGYEVEDITARARATGIARKREGQMRRTAHDLERRVALSEPISNKVRDVPLDQVLAKWGLERDPRDRQQWRATEENGGAGAHRITVKGPKWHDHAIGRGGGGAIDLVVHLSGWPPREAIGWLAREIGVDNTARAVAAEAMRTAQATAKAAAAAPAPELPLPPERVPSADHWSRARSYLVTERRLPAQIVDAEHQAGRLWADQRGSLVWPLTDENGRRVGYEWRAARPARHGEDGAPRGVVPGSRSAAGAYNLPPADPRERHVLVVEGALDALSARALGFRGRVLGLAGSEAGRGLLTALADRLKTTVRWLIGLDADRGGDRAAKALEAVLPGAERKRPQYGAKDWSEQWQLGQATSQSLIFVPPVPDDEPRPSTPPSPQ